MRKGDSKGYGTFDEERAKAYAAFAAEVFAPIYPVIALQIEKQCDVREGLCIDVGSGPALLAIALARITSLTLWAVDISKPILEIARENIVREGLAERVRPLAGDVHNMPFLDGTAGLVVSRGSARFWRNRPAALRDTKGAQTGRQGIRGWRNGRPATHCRNPPPNGEARSRMAKEVSPQSPGSRMSRGGGGS